MRYSKIPQGGYGIISRVAMCLPEVSKEAKALYALLCSYTGDKEFCWPSEQTLAKNLGTTDRTVRRYLDELLKAGLVLKEKVAPKGWNRSNKYSVQWPQPDTGDRIEPVMKDLIEPVADDPLILTMNTNKKNNNKTGASALSEQSPKLPMRTITDLFSAGYEKLTGEKLSFVGKGKQYGDAIKKLWQAAGGDMDVLEGKARALYAMLERIKRGDKKAWVKGAGFTPLTLLANWNELVGIGPKKKKFPDIQRMTHREVEDEFGENCKWGSLELKENLPAEVWEYWQKEFGGYLPDLPVVIKKFLVLGYCEMFHVKH